ncbi:hypothetical protein [Nonomuraea rubra]|uniref:PE-PGRS family protein n=2 Tax=Nonomuraea rubra TaxID=46180 RepID=A0A7X0NNU5_9ACTN|nr:hypothetical protein [Nonomuraea rubra]MBB6546867.1 hypothetical protein [Nonomuraea rubra]
MSSGDMRRWAKLNERQMATLRRIAEGESITAKDSDLARTVYALRDRGLVSTPRRDGVWIAEVTEAGRFYLEHGYYQGAAALTSPTVTSKGGRRTASPGPPSPHVLAAELIKRLQDEGGTLHVRDPDEATRALHRRALDAAKRQGLIPEGFRLLHTGRDRGDLILRLEDATHPDDTEWNRIRLSARDLITDPHELADWLREDRRSIDVTDAMFGRALEVVRALAEDLLKRGHCIGISRRGKPRGLYAHARGHQYALHIKEELDRVPHVYTEEELRSRKLYTWQRVTPEYDEVPSGRLRLELGEGRGLQCWADDKRSRVEDKIRAAVKEIERRAEADQQARLAREKAERERAEKWRRQEEERHRREAERQAARDKERAQAADQAREEHRRRVFGQALEGWARAAEIREFCRGLEALAATLPAQEATITQWVTWARAQADHMDPLHTPSVLTEANFDIEPTPEALHRYLREESRGEREPRPEEPAGVRYDDLYPSAWQWGRPGRSQWWRR